MGTPPLPARGSYRSYGQLTNTENGSFVRFVPENVLTIICELETVLAYADSTPPLAVPPSPTVTKIVQVVRFVDPLLVRV